jgi:thiol-disulfide isomerase/thioredoxin
MAAIPSQGERRCNYHEDMTRLALAFAASVVLLSAQLEIDWTEAEKPILAQVRTLRDQPDAKRWEMSKDLAMQVRKLPKTPGREELAIELSNLVTEGDAGLDTLQTTADTLALILHEQPVNFDDPYSTLAQLVRYEHLNLAGWFTGEPPERYLAAAGKLEKNDARREKADFTLRDIDGKTWTLRQLFCAPQNAPSGCALTSGKVVLVNFWATWCPPCRKEMPDLDAIYKESRDNGLVILAISNEERDKVAPFLKEHKVSYPVLLDPGSRVTGDFAVYGIPKTFVFDRSGHLAAESIDMRTKRQLLEMLRRAGL